MNNVYILLIGPVGIGKTMLQNSIKKLLKQQGIICEDQKSVLKLDLSGGDITHCLRVDGNNLVTKLTDKF